MNEFVSITHDYALFAIGGCTSHFRTNLSNNKPWTYCSLQSLLLLRFVLKYDATTNCRQCVIVDY